MNRLEHLQTIAAEECNEIAQRISKALRFGLSEIQPGQPLTNAERITEEMADLAATMMMIEKETGLSFGFTPEMLQAKMAKIERFLLLSRDCGTLTD
jgi:NTP pyrophosphatase (non-canonical NTP hydrolase)